MRQFVGGVSFTALNTRAPVPADPGVAGLNALPKRGVLLPIGEAACRDREQAFILLAGTEYFTIKQSNYVIFLNLNLVYFAPAACLTAVCLSYKRSKYAKEESTVYKTSRNDVNRFEPDQHADKVCPQTAQQKVRRSPTPKPRNEE